LAGLIQVYTGSGKGKTTAAIGLAVRTLGHGGRVLLVRFLKPEEPPSGELQFLQKTAGVEILSSGLGIIDGTADPAEVRSSVATTFQKMSGRIAAGSWNLLILDEINNAVHRGYLPLADVLRFLDHRPADLEVVLTGRHAPPAIVDRADLVTVMEAVKHPYGRGVPARPGIEY